MPTNFKDNPEALLRRVKPRVVPPQKFMSETGLVITVPSTFKDMAKKILHEFAAPSADNVPVGPRVNIGDMDFDLNTSLITMVQASPFCGMPNEDASAHLQQFMEICSTYTIEGVSLDTIRLWLFPFSRLGRVK